LDVSFLKRSDTRNLEVSRFSESFVVRIIGLSCKVLGIDSVR
jgi:hypothetical protein